MKHMAVSGLGGLEQIPVALGEIGRLRAITFRAVGEGSDAAVDRDRFDENDLHLFLWDNDKRQIVGAYRLGQTDRIVADSGVDGLYTRTLFRYDERLIQQMPARALEARAILHSRGISEELQRAVAALEGDRAVHRATSGVPPAVRTRQHQRALLRYVTPAADGVSPAASLRGGVWRARRGPSHAARPPRASGRHVHPAVH